MLISLMAKQAFLILSLVPPPKWMPSSGADMQDYTYLDQSMPGAFARWMTENRLV